MIKIKVIWIIIILSSVGVLFLLGSMMFKEYSDERSYNDIRIITESPKKIYKWGESIPVKVTVRNDGENVFVFNTTGKPINIDPKVTSLGLSEPRPVYDLVVRMGVWNEPEGFWILSQNIKKPLPTEIILQPHETRELIETVWEPEKPFFFVDIFVRFADFEFPTGIEVEQPKR